MSGFIDEQKLPIKAILIGVGISAAVTMLLTLLICGVFSVASVAVPYRLLPYIMLIAVAGGVFTGAYTAAAMNKSKGLIIGLICGFLLFIVMFIAGLGTGETIGLNTLLRCAVLLLFGALGGIKGVNKKEKLRI